MNENLPEGWAKVTLSDICSKPQYGWTSKAGASGEVKYLRTTDISSGKLDWNIVPYCIESPENVEKYQIHKDDILVSRAGSVGLSLRIKENVNFPAVFASYLIRFVPSKYVAPKYIEYFLQSEKYREQISDITSGIAILNVNGSKLENIHLPLAPLAEQNRIVEKLDELMSKIQAAQEQLNLIPTILKRFRQGVLSAAISGRLTKDWRGENLEVEDIKRLLERVRLDRLKNNKNLIEKAKIEQIFNYVEEGNHFEIPHSWSFIRLSKLCYSFDYGTSKKSDNDEGEIPVLRMGNLQNGKIDWNSLKYSSDSSDIKKYRLKKGDVLFNRTNSPELVGKTAIYRGEKPAIFAGYLVRINTSFGINPEYLNFVLNSNYARNWCLEVKSDGVSQSNISAQKLSEFELPLCPLEEQETIIKRVENMFKWANELEGKYLSTKKYIDSIPQILLAKAFSGEITEQNPDDEPVILLLERIKAEREVERQKPTEKKTRKSNKYMESKKSVIEIVRQEFGQNAFTFDELRKHTSKPYEEIKAELYTMLQAAESAVDYITMNFNSDTETMTFQLKNHAN